MNRRTYDANYELENAMFWHLVWVSLVLIAVGLMIWYALLLFDAYSIQRYFLLRFAILIIFLPLTIYLSVKGTLLVMEAGAKQGIRYFFWAILWQNFFFLNIIIIILLYVFRNQLGRFFRRLVDSNFFVQHHFVILLLLSIILVGCTMRYAIRMKKLDWDMLDKLKMISVISPAYCFAGATLWSKTLQPLGISPKNASLLAKASIVSGLLFLFFLLMYVVLRPRDNESASKDVPRLVDSTGKCIDKEKDPMTVALYATAFIIALGISLFLSTVLDAAYLMLRE